MILYSFKLRFLLVVIFTMLMADNAQSQSYPTIDVEGDSVRYEGKLYSFAWNDGYQKGLTDGKSNQYNIHEEGDKKFYKRYNDRTEVSSDWAAGYKKGYASGIANYDRTRDKDYLIYNGKTVSKEWYDKHVEYETAFMPGFSYNFIIPQASDSLGYFQGVGIEYLFYANVTQNENPGPSHIRFYGRLNLLKSSRKDIIADAFAYTLGIDLSLEKNPKRSFLVPYFGLETGGISQKQVGTILQFTPTFGLHLLSKRNIFASIQGGYIYPIKKFDELRGYTMQASVNIAFW